MKLKSAVLFSLCVGTFLYILHPIHASWDCWWWNCLCMFVASVLIDGLRRLDP